MWSCVNVTVYVGICNPGVAGFLQARFAVIASPSALHHLSEKTSALFLSPQGARARHQVEHRRAQAPGQWLQPESYAALRLCCYPQPSNLVSYQLLK